MVMFSVILPGPAGAVDTVAFAGIPLRLSEMV